MAMTRKDYGDANPAPSNEALKRVNFMNTPFSVQQLGLDKSKDAYLPASEINFANFKTNTRVLRGNKQGVVKAVTFTGVNPNEVLETATFTFEKNGTAYDEGPFTVAEIQAMGDVFFAVPQP